MQPARARDGRSRGGARPGGAPLEGKRVTDKQLTAEFDASWEKILPRPEALSGGSSWNVSSDETVALDHLTAAEWIETRIEGGLDRRSARRSRSATRRCGIDVEELCRSHPLRAPTSSPGDLRPTGDSDERYVVREGSGRVPEELVKRIGDGRIETQVPLVALRREGEGAVIVLEDGRGRARSPPAAWCWRCRSRSSARST